MRVAIPLIPWAISVSLERRSRQALRWRYRLRTLLILVAIVALIMGGWVARRRHQIWQRQQQVWNALAPEYRGFAERWARIEASYLESAATGKAIRGVVGDEKGWRVYQLGPAEHKRMAAHSGRLKRKYEQAAASPWLPFQLEPELAESEASRIADEQGAVPTAEPPPWVPRGPSTALSKASMTPGQ
jgi:hypothetical protein